MDFGDNALDAQEKDLKYCLSARRFAHRSGPSKCSKCGYTNDRSEEGYCICSECMEGSSITAG